MNQSQVVNYVIQFFQSACNSRKSYSGMRISQTYSVHMHFKTDDQADGKPILPHESIILIKEGSLQLDTDIENVRFKTFMQHIHPETTLQDIADKLKYPLEEVVLFTRHLLYYKKAIQVGKLDDYSYFMVRGTQSAIAIVQIEQKIYRDYGVNNGLNVCAFLGQQKSWAQIKQHYPYVQTQTLINILCQLLSKGIVKEVSLYLDTDDEQLQARQRDMSVKHMLADRLIDHRRLDRIIKGEEEGTSVIFRL